MTTLELDSAVRVVPLATGLRLARRRRAQRAQLPCRAADFCLAAALLIAALPLMAIAALAIKLGSAGPVFTSCRRVVGDGNVIAVRQFRVTARPVQMTTMCWDKKTTLVGRALCSTGANSLPQLLNVLRGDMTLLGRSGERPDFLPHR
ncbi:MAG: sugar transferase [Thiohalocapsa sp.]